MAFRKFKKNKTKNTLVEPDEIFLESKNLENFDRQQFEGRIEKPIPKKTIMFLGAFFIFISVVFGFRLMHLQIQNGDAYRKRSENNTLEKVTIFTERGIIYDRNGRELAWNKKTEGLEPFGMRVYLSPGFSHVLGYVSYPTKDNADRYWQSEFMGKDKRREWFKNNRNGCVR